MTFQYLIIIFYADIHLCLSYVINNRISIVYFWQYFYSSIFFVICLFFQEQIYTYGVHDSIYTMFQYTKVP
jgi:hypothetical protein